MRLYLFQEKRKILLCDLSFDPIFMMFVYLQAKDLSIQQVALIAFRDHVVLKSELEGKIFETTLVSHTLSQLWSGIRPWPCSTRPLIYPSTGHLTVIYKLCNGINKICLTVLLGTLLSKPLMTLKFDID